MLYYARKLGTNLKNNLKSTYTELRFRNDQERWGGGNPTREYEETSRNESVKVQERGD